jgi:hypothetical protein
LVPSQAGIGERSGGWGADDGAVSGGAARRATFPIRSAIAALFASSTSLAAVCWCGTAEAVFSNGFESGDLSGWGQPCYPSSLYSLTGCSALSNTTVQVCLSMPPDPATVDPFGSQFSSIYHDPGVLSVQAGPDCLLLTTLPQEPQLIYDLILDSTLLAVCGASVHPDVDYCGWVAIPP